MRVAHRHRRCSCASRRPSLRRSAAGARSIARRRRRLTLDEAIARAIETSHRLGELRAREAASDAVRRAAAGGRPAACCPRRAATRGPTTSTSSRSTRPDRPASRSSTRTSPTTTARGSTCSGRSTPAAAPRRSSAPRDAERQASGKDLDSGARRPAPRNHARVLGARDGPRVRARRRASRSRASTRSCSDVRSALRRRLSPAERRALGRGAASRSSACCCIEAAEPARQRRGRPARGSSARRVDADVRARCGARNAPAGARDGRDSSTLRGPGARRTRRAAGAAVPRRRAPTSGLTRRVPAIARRSPSAAASTTRGRTRDLPARRTRGSTSWDAGVNVELDALWTAAARAAEVAEARSQRRGRARAARRVRHAARARSPAAAARLDVGRGADRGRAARPCAPRTEARRVVQERVRRRRRDEHRRARRAGGSAPGGARSHARAGQRAARRGAPGARAGTVGRTVRACATRPTLKLGRTDR